MADNNFSFSALLSKEHKLPDFQDMQDFYDYIEENFMSLYRNRNLYKDTATILYSQEKDTLNYVETESRNGRLKNLVELICKTSKAIGLEYIYGSKLIACKREFGCEYFSYRCHELSHHQIKQSLLSLQWIFDWSINNVERLRGKDLFYYATPEELEDAILRPIVTPEPTFDERVMYSDDGDSIYCVFSYLASLQQLLRDALKLNQKIFHMVQVFRN